MLNIKPNALLCNQHNFEFLKTFHLYHFNEAYRKHKRIKEFKDVRNFWMCTQKIYCIVIYPNRNLTCKYIKRTERKQKIRLFSCITIPTAHIQ